MHLELDPSLNVFVGVNGSGKSTVLDAVAIMLSWAVNRIRSVGASGRSILEADIANDSSSALINISCINDNQNITWKLAKSRKGHGASETHSSFNSLNEFTKQIQAKIAEEQENVDIPLFLYYPVNRAVLNIPLKIRKKHLFNLLNIYDESLTSGANFRTFFEWFREREDLENESRKGQSNLSDLIKNFTILDDEINNHEKTKSMDAVPEYQRNLQYLYWKRSCETYIKEIFSNDSSIYKDFSTVAIALVGDLARIMAIANPMKENPLEGNGIVLIDEIDLHLHPKWQRTVVSKLTEVFPNCQFIISTHSPHIINHVRPENIFMLKQTDEGIVAMHPSKSYGNNVDRILEDLMGLETTRPDEVFQELRNIFSLIGSNSLSDAVEKIADLKKKIGTDPEIVKAEVLLARKEIIGK